jgi:predicted DNA-binding transcriptional regulator YafY
MDRPVGNRKSSNRKEPKDAILRQWTMLQLIPREPHGITAQQLRHKLTEADPLYEVHKRTIERNLMALMSVFPTLDYDAQSGGNRWHWKKDEVLDIPKLDVQTALMFRLAEVFLTPLIPRSTLADLGPHFRKAEKVLQEVGEHCYAQWPDKVKVLSSGMALLHPDIDPGVLAVVYTALFEDRRFVTRYRPRNGPERDYQVSPRGLVYRDGILYVVSTLFDYTDLKHLSLHRMDSADLLDEPVKPMKRFNLERYVREYFDYPLQATETTGSAAGRVTKNLSVRLLFDGVAALHLEESPLSSDQRIQHHPDGSVEFTATVANTMRLRWWLLGFGDRVEVLAPEGLRAEIAQTAAKMMAKYESCAKPYIESNPRGDPCGSV